MTPTQLRYFLALCGTKNFTRAARRCAVSQPSLTNAIKALEDEMGGALFIRRPQIQLTILGRALRPHFRSIIKAIDKTPQIAAAFVAKAQRWNGRAPLSTPQHSDPRVAVLEPQLGRGSEAPGRTTRACQRVHRESQGLALRAACPPARHQGGPAEKS
jgi:DNA-binding transcriptional LysR family regulator